MRVVGNQLGSWGQLAGLDDMPSESTGKVSDQWFRVFKFTSMKRRGVNLLGPQKNDRQEVEGILSDS